MCWIEVLLVFFLMKKVAFIREREGGACHDAFILGGPLGFEKERELVSKRTTTIVISHRRLVEITVNARFFIHLAVEKKRNE